MSSTSDEAELTSMVLRGRWQLLKKIGQGAFGSIYVAEDMETGEKVAVKVESLKSKKQVLKCEVAVLKKLQDCRRVAGYISCGRNSECNYLVMDLLGDNLSDIRKSQPEQRFSLATSIRLGTQMLRAIEAMHKCGYVHRDIKPSNFCVGKSKKRKQVFILDFGLSRRIIEPDGEHRPERQNVGFRGTARYASIHSHHGKDLGRRDDLLSLFYVIIEFLVGALPWRKLREKDEIGEKKEQYSGADLVEGLPSEMLGFYDHVNSLEFDEEPNYALLRLYLNEMYLRSEPHRSDWELSYNNGRDFKKLGHYVDSFLRKGSNKNRKGNFSPALPENLSTVASDKELLEKLALEEERKELSKRKKQQEAEQKLAMQTTGQDSSSNKHIQVQDNYPADIKVTSTMDNNVQHLQKSNVQVNIERADGNLKKSTTTQALNDEIRRSSAPDFKGSSVALLETQQLGTIQESNAKDNGETRVTGMTSERLRTTSSLRTANSTGKQSRGGGLFSGRKNTGASSNLNSGKAIRVTPTKFTSRIIEQETRVGSLKESFSEAQYGGRGAVSATPSKLGAPMRMHPSSSTHSLGGDNGGSPLPISLSHMHQLSFMTGESSVDYNNQAVMSDFPNTIVGDLSIDPESSRVPSVSGMQHAASSKSSESSSHRAKQGAVVQPEQTTKNTAGTREETSGCKCAIL